MKDFITKAFLLFACGALASHASHAQDEKYGDTPEQQLLCKEGLSVYRSYKKQKNYAEAYTQWRKACEVCPETASEGIYADGTSFINTVSMLPFALSKRSKSLALPASSALVTACVM